MFLNLWSKETSGPCKIDMVFSADTKKKNKEGPTTLLYMIMVCKLTCCWKSDSWI